MFFSLNALGYAHQYILFITQLYYYAKKSASTDEITTADELNAQAADRALQATLQAIDEKEEENEVEEEEEGNSDGDESESADIASVESFTDLRHSKVSW